MREDSTFASSIRGKGPRARRRRRGVALVMVLGAITVLTVFLTQLQAETSAELSAALAERDALRAEYYARSGINLSRMLIATEPTVRTGIAPIASLLLGGRKLPQIPVWNFSDMILGAFNDQFGAQAFAGIVPNADYSTAKNLGATGGGHFELTIVDEDAKLNVNTVATQAGSVASELHLGASLLGLFASPQYNPLFELRDGDGQFSDRASICGAIVDWADPDENLFACNPQASGPSSGGAEDNFYQTIGLPYRRKNAAFDSLEELRLVRGMSDEFWATFVDPDPSNPKKRVLTVWGQGAVNVNTANAMTILAVICGNAPETELCVDPAQMQTFVMAVTLVRSLTMGAPLFASKKEFISAMQGQGMMGQIFSALQLKPVIFKDAKGVESVISTESKMFSMYVDGVVPGFRKETRVRIHAVVDFRQAASISASRGGGPGGAMSPAGSAIPGGAAGSAGGPPGGMSPGGSTTGPAPGGAMMPGGVAPAIPGVSGPGSQPVDPSQLTPESAAAALATNPGGTIVYFRIE